MLENWFVGMSAPSWKIEVTLKIKIFDFFFFFFFFFFLENEIVVG